MRVAAVLRNRDFNLYWAGVVFSQIGTRGTVAANLYHVYQLTGSVTQTGLVGAGQAVALLVLSPLGGVFADRWDRRRLLQWSQAVAMVVAGALAVLTLTGHIVAWQVLVSVVLTTAAATFDQPARQALIPALVPRAQLPQAFALLNPSREIAVLLGPALAGVFIGIAGPGLMYAVDAGTYAVLVVILQLLRVAKLAGAGSHTSVWRQLADGARFVKGRKIIWMLMSLDLSATLFGAYRVVLPALCATVFHVGPQGYGVLSAAPSAGALLATYTVFRVVDRTRRLGRVLLVSTVFYGLSNIVLAQAHIFVIAVAAGLLIGASTRWRRRSAMPPCSSRRRTSYAAECRRFTRCRRAAVPRWVTLSLGRWPVRSAPDGADPRRCACDALRGLLHGPAESGPLLPGGGAEEDAAVPT